MESVIGIIFSVDNLRMLVLLAFGFGFYVLVKGQIRDLQGTLKKETLEQLKEFHVQLKANDFAHLNATIEALTFTLEKNGFLKREDKEYIDSRLDER